MGLYIHIPFCMKKCNYCDFLSFDKVSQEVINTYFQSLLREISYFGDVYGNEYYVNSVFIGGGTPSIVEEIFINEMMGAVRIGFKVDNNAEISIETNPKTLTERKLRKYLDSGINRLSMGTQSCDDSLLRYLGRAHTSEDFLRNYFSARKCGFLNINIDLMFGIPGQTLGMWIDTLNKVIELSPEHISFYSLQIEDGTKFYSMLQEGSLIESDDQLDRSMYHFALNLLKKNGYNHYEISNAAKGDYECRHNLKYWSMEDYLGLGLGAHSFIEGMRFRNVTSLEQYVSIGQKYKKNVTDESTSPFSCWHHKNSEKDNISDYLITVMRKTQGVRLEDFKNRFGTDLKQLYGNVLQKYQDQGLLEIFSDRICFTEKGIDLSNIVLAEFV